MRFTAQDVDWQTGVAVANIAIALCRLKQKGSPEDYLEDAWELIWEARRAIASYKPEDLQDEVE